MNESPGNPVVVVTGGTGGAAGLAGAAHDVEAAGRRCPTITTDVADRPAVDNAAARVEAEPGEIDVWVNVAFAGSLAFFPDTSPEPDGAGRATDRGPLRVDTGHLVFGMSNV